MQNDVTYALTHLEIKIFIFVLGKEQIFSFIIV